MSEGMGASAPASSSNSSASQSSGGASTAVQNSVVPANLSQSTKEPAQSPKQSYRVKVDGQEIEVDHDELIAGYRHNKAATKRFQEASELSKQAKSVLDALEKGDIKFIEQKLGKEKAKALFEDYLIQDMEYQALSPAEKRARELEHENKTLKQRQEDEEAARKEAAYKQDLQKAHQDLDNEVHEALAELGVKPTPRLALRIVDTMIAALEKGGSPLAAKDASKRALSSVHQDIAEFLPHLSVEDLVKILPQKVRDSLREYEVNRVMGEKSQRRPRAQSERPRTDKQKPVGVDAWFDKLEKRYK